MAQPGVTVAVWGCVGPVPWVLGAGSGVVRLCFWWALVAAGVGLLGLTFVAGCGTRARARVRACVRALLIRHKSVQAHFKKL